MMKNLSHEEQEDILWALSEHALNLESRQGVGSGKARESAERLRAIVAKLTAHW